MLSLSLPQGLTLPVSTSAAALPLSMPPCQTIRMAESLSPYTSAQAMSIMLPTFSRTTTLEKASVTASSMARSASVR